MIEPVAVERFFRSLDREVWIVTSGDDDLRGGLLATWVMQATLSAQRPVLLAGIAPNHHTAQVIDHSGCFAAHLLREDQIDIGLQMAATSGHEVDKLAGWQTSPASTTVTAPVLTDCLGWAAGPVFARLDAGDRIFYWAEVTALRAPAADAGGPLRQSQLLAAAPDDIKQILRDDREQDTLRHAPLHQQWREAIRKGVSRITEGE